MDIEKARKRFIPMSETMLYILPSLLGERHGYAIMQHVKEITRGRITLGAGTVYQSLQKLEVGGLISSTIEIERRKMYLIMTLGQQILKEEAQRIKEIYLNMEELL